MNWKKEGYKIGQEVFLLRVCAFGTNTVMDKGTVSHVGTKLLKVDCSPKMQLTFRESNRCSGGLYGVMYYLYKTKEDYMKEEKQAEIRKELENKVKKDIDKLTNEQLEIITQWIEGEKKDDKKGAKN